MVICCDSHKMGWAGDFMEFVVVVPCLLSESKSLGKCHGH